LIREQQNININHLQFNNTTLLHIAATHNYKKDIIDYLIKKGANPKVLDIFNRSILDIAIAKKRIDIIKYLIKNNDKFLLSISQSNIKEAFFLAISYQDVAFIEYLSNLEISANIPELNKFSSTNISENNFYLPIGALCLSH
jgi:ankyrin repeat protein